MVWDNRTVYGNWDWVCEQHLPGVEHLVRYVVRDEGNACAVCESRFCGMGQYVRYIYGTREQACSHGIGIEFGSPDYRKRSASRCRTESRVKEKGS